MFETNANVESEWRVALFCCCLEKNVSQKNSSGVAGRCFLRFFCFFYSFRFLFVCSFLHGLRMFEKNAFTTTSLSTFLLSLTKHHQKMPNPKKIFSQKSPHNLASHHHHHHRDIKRTREELFSFSERERV